ncbi:hypothetical protein TIFTF001_012542 [Ficus carica]|uniref:Uncharacterized protein n=1 Tax=Ficus carica TaxID=3494 RepID=A0AA88AG36_FICCA|nr:hypothetical protein TIFTF001_012542 [Ficus carica]
MTPWRDPPSDRDSTMRSVAPYSGSRLHGNRFTFFQFATPRQMLHLPPVCNSMATVAPSSGSRLHGDRCSAGNSGRPARA